MLRFSFSTVYMAVISINILLIFITICFRNTRVMVNLGYKLLSLFVSFTLIRSLLPIEFPFTKTVLLPEWISMFISRVRHPLFYIAEHQITLWTILQCIWLIGILFQLIQYIHSYVKSRYYILANSLDVTTLEPYRTILNQICAERKKKNKFQVLQMTGISIPHLYGIFSPRILIPEHFTLTRETLYYVLVHEASHHFHHDLIIKQLVRLITMIYWWNPFCSILVKHTDMILEMRIDDTITLSDKQTISDYLNCLIQLAAESTETLCLPRSLTMSLLSQQEGELTKRFHMLTATSKKKKYSLNAFLLIGIIGIYILSHAYIWEASYIPTEIAEEYIISSSDNTYAVLKEDGTFDVYAFGIFMENTDTLEYFDPGIPIYTEKENRNETN